MKILLVGEFSGFHGALKDGLIKLGHEVTLVGSPDGFKNFSIDVNLWPNYNIKPKILKAFIKQFTIINGIKELNDYDIVQFISPTLFYSKIPLYGLLFNSLIYNRIIKNNNKANFFLVACGTDPVYSEIGVKLLKYNPLNKDKEHNKKSSIWHNHHKALEWNIKLLKYVSSVIPASYDYKVGYQKVEDVNYLSKVIPMPINVGLYNYSTNTIKNGKIKILHGITRPGFKGSNIIRSSLDKLIKKYANFIDVKIVSKLSINEYLKFVEDTNILVDQCNSYGYGINALIGMAYGKIVLSGAEEEAIKELEVNDCPVINIKPDSEHIYKVIEDIIENENEINIRGYKSREYVEKYHDCAIIAQQYIKEWIRKN